jgi:Flp pilus assembly protein TadB
MIYLLCFLFSCSVGFVAFRTTSVFLRRMDIYHENLQIKILTGLSRERVPLRFYVERIERLSSGFFKSRVLGLYFDYLTNWINRSSQRELRAAQLFSYQVFIFLISFLLVQSLIQNVLVSLAAALLGACLPVSWIRDRALRREDKILRELPNALEILSLCVEAGLSLEQGLVQYLENTGSQPLANEFSKVLEQTKMGSSRKEALQAMSSRVNLTDVSLLVTSIIHAEKFGTGVSKTLRQLSATLRDKQAQRIEKKVNELPVKMLLPLLLFIMPVTFLIIFGPVLLSFFN